MIKSIVALISLISISLSGCEAGSEIGLKSKSPTLPAASSGDAAASNTKAEKPLGYLLGVDMATENQLKRVPGMTPEILKLITDTRPFLDMFEFDDELSFLELSDRRRSALYEHLFKVIDVNNAPAEDFKFVPGLSKAVVHKIQNGRPYKSAADLKDVIKASRQSDDLEDLMPYFKVESSKK